MRLAVALASGARPRGRAQATTGGGEGGCRMGESPGQRRRRGEGRTSRLSVRLNDRELRAVARAGAGAGLSVTRLLVDAAFAQPAQPADRVGAAGGAAGESAVRSRPRRSRGSSSGGRRGEDRSLRLSVRLNGPSATSSSSGRGREG